MSPAPTCPRCGYDLSGISHSWKDTCPLDGTCSECGLIFLWAELLNPALTIPIWSFEHAVHHLFRRWHQTIIKTLHPARFWSTIRIEHPIHRRRLVIFALAAALLAHLLTAAVMAGVTYHGRLHAPAVTIATFNINLNTTRSLRPTFTRVNPAHDALPGALLALLYPYLPITTGSTLATTQLSASPAWAILIISWLMPLPFLILSDTFSIARVRFVHLLRGWAYSQPLCAAATALGLCVHALTMSPATVPFLKVYVGLAVLAGTLTIAWLMFWWGCFCFRYLRLPGVHIVLPAMAIITLLATTAWIVYIQPAIASLHEAIYTALQP